MAQLKVFNEINERLEAIEAKLSPATAPEAPQVTKEQLMELKGVGESLADQILALINGE